jgi:hypothetical protein
MSAQARRYHTLVCVSTAQEIINALPALELGVARVLTLVTDGARKAGWAENLAAGLKGIEVEQVALPPEQEDSPHEIKRLILEALEERGLGRGVALGWGGGQKPHSAGLWLAFEALHGAHPAEALIIYIDANRNQKQVWTDPQAPAARTEFYQAAEEGEERPKRLDLDRLLALSGLRQTPKSQGLIQGAQPCARLWPPSAEALPAWAGEACDLFAASQGFRRVCFELAAMGSDTRQRADADQLEAQFKAHPFDDFGALVWEAWPKSGVPASLDAKARNWIGQNLAPTMRKRLLEEAKRQARLAYDAEPTVALPEDEGGLAWLRGCNEGLGASLGRGTCVAPQTLKFSQLFEVLLAERVRRWAQERAKRGKAPREILLNLEFQQRSGREATAELDITILTQAGQVVTLDAKSFAVDKATQHAQERRFQTLGGSFGKRWICWPMFTADCGQPDRRTPEDTWGNLPWYPKELVEQIKYWRADREDFPKEALKLIPYDDTSALEDMLDQETGVASRPARASG